MPLEILAIEHPCTAAWTAMQGDERVRHCQQCHLDVYDLSEMSRADAERLVAEHEGGVCVRMWKRADGTVITHDCEPLRAEPRACVPFPATHHPDSAARAAEPTRG